MAACLFYHDPLRKVDFLCSKNSHEVDIFWASKLTRIIQYLPKRMLTSQTSLLNIKCQQLGLVRGHGKIDMPPSFLLWSIKQQRIEKK